MLSRAYSLVTMLTKRLRFVCVARQLMLVFYFLFFKGGLEKFNLETSTKISYELSPLS